jgi:hypothetical protein
MVIAKAVVWRKGDRFSLAWASAKAIALQSGWRVLGTGIAVLQRADLAWEENVLPMHGLWVGTQCDRADVGVSGEEDVGVGVEKLSAG